MNKHDYIPPHTHNDTDNEDEYETLDSATIENAKRWNKQNPASNTPYRR